MNALDIETTAALRARCYSRLGGHLRQLATLIERDARGRFEPHAATEPTTGLSLQAAVARDIARLRITGLDVPFAMRPEWNIPGAPGVTQRDLQLLFADVVAAIAMRPDARHEALFATEPQAHA